MKMHSRNARTEAEIWLQILHPEREITPKIARQLLSLSIPDKEIGRMNELSAKARAGTLSSEEEVEMDGFERAGSILSTLKSKARQVLKRSSQSA